MNKVLNGRMITVMVVTILSLVFVWPTARYFNFINSLPEDADLTVQQEEQRRELLAQGGMIKPGLDLQGGVEFLFQLDTNTMRDREIQVLADSLVSEFRDNRVDASISIDEETGDLVVEGVSTEDSRIARDIILERERDLEAQNLDDLGTQPVRMAYRADQWNEMIRNSLDAALRTIRERVDQYGLTQPTVVKQPPERILVQIPGETDPERVRENLLRTANLEFRLLHPNHDTEVRNFVDLSARGPDGELLINQMGTSVIRPEFLREEQVEAVSGISETRIVVDQAAAAAELPPGYMLFLGEESRFNEAGAAQPIENLGYILRSRPELTGDSLRRANYFMDPAALENPHKVLLEFDPQGTEKFAEVTEDNVQRRFAIVLDGVVRSAPNINEPIRHGRCEISGSFSQEEAHDLALVLKAGSLPAPLRIVQDQAIGASLGRESVVKSGQALIIGAVFLILLMLYVYRTAGGISIFAMILNVLFILMVLSLADATLTLSGVGGILLTMGMAVDANVLIYERLREELADGKPLRGAMSAAFGRAFTVILDSNITTLLPAIVLLSFEIISDSVRGFWTALAIGLIANLYTGLTVTRALMESWVAKRKTINVGKPFPFFEKVNFDFMGYRKWGYPISGTLVGISVFYLVVHGVNPGVDFTGGVVATVEVRDTETVNHTTLTQAFEGPDAFETVKVVKVINEPLYQVTVPKVSEEQQLTEIRSKVETILATNFQDATTIRSTQSIESIVGDEFKVSGFLTVLVASLVILGYIALRFRPVFGMGAVLALVHDLTISLGLFVALGHNLTLEIVSGLLIILGYSVNDTIVVFDRIREYQGTMWGKKMNDIINAGINRTLARTTLTSSSTLITILAMYLFGGVALRDFALILLIGIVMGTYSSIFVASSLVSTYITAKEKREGMAAAHGRKTVKIGS